MPRVKVSQNQMRQVFLNILKNAVEAMPQGGTLFVTTEREGALLRIIIRDTGIGMTEEVRKKIFDAFFTTKEQVKGVGLAFRSVTASSATTAEKLRSTASRAKAPPFP